MMPRMARDAYIPFPITPWSSVRVVATSTGVSRQQALEILLRRYYPAMHSYLVRVRRIGSSEADDLLQSFIADKILAGDLIRHADERRGKFRTFLLTSLNHYSISRFRSSRSSEAHSHPTQPLSTEIGPPMVVEIAWAREMLASVLVAMERECQEIGRPDVWIIFRGRILAPIFAGVAPVAYPDLAKQAGVASSLQAANLLVTAKRMFVRLLREAISEYAQDDQEIDDEIQDLQEALMSRD